MEVSHLFCTTEVNDTNTEKIVVEEHVFNDFDKISSKLEKAFQNLGLTRFSSSVAKQYLIVSFL
jgi:hypothetical protein